MAKSSKEKQKEIGQRIRIRRRQLGLSQEELARKLHKQSAAFIALIEAGERNISMMDLLLLAKHLKTTTTELIHDKKDVPTVSDALRNDTALSETDRSAIESIYNSLKNNRDGNS